MAPFHLRDLALTAGVVAIFVWLLAVFGPSLDDHHDEIRQAQSLSDAQQQAQRDMRRDMAAAALCREQNGEAGYQWTAAGELVCVPRHGHAVMVASVSR